MDDGRCLAICVSDSDDAVKIKSSHRVPPQLTCAFVSRRLTDISSNLMLQNDRSQMQYTRFAVVVCCLEQFARFDRISSLLLD